MLGKYRDNECICDITVQPCKERSKIVCGKKLSGFKEDEFNGVKCFSLYIPEVKNGGWSFTDLYVDGERASLTRYPEKGTQVLENIIHDCICAHYGGYGIYTDEKPVFVTNGVNSGIMSHHNFIYDISGREPVMFNVNGYEFVFSEVQKMGLEDGSIVKNPELTENYNMDEDSELLNFGFKKIRNLIINRS